MTDPFAHLVSIDKASRKLIIERVYADGRRELFTEAAIPLENSEDMLQRFALQLGENLLLDSPSARELFDL
jgi:hypothetical protein